MSSNLASIPQRNCYWPLAWCVLALLHGVAAEHLRMATTSNNTEYFCFTLQYILIYVILPFGCQSRDSFFFETAAFLFLADHSVVLSIVIDPKIMAIVSSAIVRLITLSFYSRFFLIPSFASPAQSLVNSACSVCSVGVCVSASPCSL